MVVEEEKHRRRSFRRWRGVNGDVGLGIFYRVRDAGVWKLSVSLGGFWVGFSFTVVQTEEEIVQCSRVHGKEFRDSLSAFVVKDLCVTLIGIVTIKSRVFFLFFPFSFSY